MRVIKFRAFSEKRKQMEDVDLVKGRPVRAGYQWFSPKNDLCDSQPMQYTGLKDKNGAEIFEGDILSYVELDEDSCMGAEKTYVGSVIWLDEAAKFMFKHTSGRRIDLNFIVGFYLVHDVKVIGNIYQNPELLEVSNDAN